MKLSVNDDGRMFQTYTPTERAMLAVRKRIARRQRNVGHPATADYIYTDAEFEFLKAIEEYQRRTGHRFPTWHEVLHVLMNIGYRKLPATAIRVDENPHVLPLISSPAPPDARRCSRA